ncbi:hypothetical protein HDU97_001899 [Phlyctochytrium planicorne]|nr:hypothetical protein HDU97_001899 [Phlyctochytrium planicorne]
MFSIAAQAQQTASSNSSDLLKQYELPTFIVLGDSLTQFSFNPKENGWAASIQSSYVRTVDVINRGFAGYTTRDMLPLITPILSAYPSSSPTHPLLLTLWLGTNDAVLEGFSQHVPLEDYKTNLKTLLTTAKSIHPSLKVVLITPPPTDVASLTDKNRSLQSTKEYCQASLTIGQWASSKWGRDIAILDTWAAMGVSAKMEEQDIVNKIRPLLRDGLHFSAEGSALIGDGILSTISASWEELKPAKLLQLSEDSFQKGSMPTLPKDSKGFRLSATRTFTLLLSTITGLALAIKNVQSVTAMHLTSVAIVLIVIKFEAESSPSH